MCRRAIALLILFVCMGVPAMALAVAPNLGPSPPATQAQVAALQQTIRDAQSSGDDAWVLISAALVLMMTGPGLALFYGGVGRGKKVLGTMMQRLFLMGGGPGLWGGRG